MLGHIKKLMMALSLIIGLTTISFSQGSFGELKGTVVDTNGAVVTGATVEITNNLTGEKRTDVTNDSGTYYFPKLIVGKYSVTATKTGFATSTVKDVTISVAFTTETNITLSVGGGEETVTIQAGDTVTQVNTNDQQLSTLLDNKKILELPLLSRDPNGLILLSPGTSQTNSGLGGFTVNGSRERNNNFLLDGVDNNDTEVPGIPGGLATPNIDATQEFRVLTGSFNAEYGRNTGAIITVATRNGSNEFHGGAYIYYRSDAFAARDFFDVSGSPDPLQRKQYGASIGGPIKREKAFFFFNYEGDRFNVGSQQVRIVPSASARTGILQTGAANFGTLDIRPTSANNIFGLPVNTAIRNLLNIYPLGNSTADSPLPGVFDAYRFTYLSRNKSDSIASRIDYKISEKHNFTGSYNFTQGKFAAGADTFPGFNDAIQSPQRGQVVSLNLVSTFTPNVVNELRFGLNRSKANFFGPGDGGVSSFLPEQINSAFRAAGYPLARSFGGVNGQTINLATGSITSLTGFDSQRRFTGTTSAGDSVTFVNGSHNYKFGGEFRWIYSNSDTNFGRSETLLFDYPTLAADSLIQDNGGNPIDPFSPLGGLINNYASYLYGLVVQQTQSQYFNKNKVRVDNDFRGFRVREWDLFFQDSWRVKSNFTLNYGVRYEVKGVPYEVNGQFATLVSFDPSTAEPAGGFRFDLVGKRSGSTQKLYEDDFNNFAPRFGFNYSPNFEHGFIAKLTGGPGKTSIRGGYGVYYDRVFGNLFVNARGNPPFQQDFLDFPVDTLENIARPPTQVASQIVPTDAGIFPVIFALPNNNQFQKKFATPYEQKWSFGFQRQIGNEFLLEADYVGGKGTNELRVIDGQLASVPRVNAITGSTTAISNSLVTNIQNGTLNDAFFQVALNLAVGFSSYNALQTRVTKRLTNKTFGTGEIQAAYTWSHSIDNAADPLVGQGGERTFPRDSSGFAGGFSAPERGSSGFDTRHRFVLNFVYDLPFKFENKALDMILGNFTISGIESVQSGRPYSVFGNRDSAGTGLSQRADFGNGSNNLPASTLAPNPRVQTGPSRTLFTNPCPADSVITPVAGGGTSCVGARRVGRQGYIGRSAFVGPGFNKFDFSVIKRFLITERVKFRIQADFFNLFNRVNFDQPVSTINSENFGRSVNTLSSPRLIQFAARFEF